MLAYPTFIFYSKHKYMLHPKIGSFSSFRFLL
nr:MAG TPA: hypothetical protein [Caudoviricetes sp.]